MTLSNMVAAGFGLFLGVVVMMLRSRRASGVDGVRSDPVTSIDDEWGIVRRELDRARRYKRRFVLIRLPEASLHGGADAKTTLGAVTRTLRTLDFAWVDGSGVHIMLPEAGREEGVACIQRLRESISGFDHELARTAVFPDDGVTSGALAALLDGRVDELPATEDLPARADQVRRISSGRRAS